VSYTTSGNSFTVAGGQTANIHTEFSPTPTELQEQTLHPCRGPFVFAPLIEQEGSLTSGPMWFTFLPDANDQFTYAYRYSFANNSGNPVTFKVTYGVF
jgi:hypothetical protein